jgi:hypothetical protein
MIGKKTNLEKGKEERQSIPKQTTLFVVFLFFIFYFLFLQENGRCSRMKRGLDDLLQRTSTNLSIVSNLLFN